MIKKGVIFLILIAAMFSINSVSGQQIEQKQETGKVTGVVTDIDWVAGNIVVRTADLGDLQDLTFIVSDETKVVRGGGPYGFANINVDDTVTVEYVKNSSVPQALTITVLGQ